MTDVIKEKLNPFVEEYRRTNSKKLLRNSKKSYYSNLNIKKLQITIWKTIIPLFTKKNLKGEKINLIENGNNILNNTELCDISSMVFSLILFPNLTSLKSINVF